MSMERKQIPVAGVSEILGKCAAAPCMQRLLDVGMNCGCEYTSFPRFARLKPYSRFDHSLGVALIVRRFTHEEKQAVAGLLHDVATPVFAHVVDFLKGDYLVQESTEAGTRAIIESDEMLCGVLREYGLTPDDVCDYHRYPIADNDSPRLSADRLEYTLGNLVNFRIRTPDTASRYLSDLSVGTNEDGAPELVFSNAKTAEDFAFASLACSKIYVSDEDRYAMQMLSELLRFALDRGVLTEADLHTTEPEVIGKLLKNAETAARWNGYCAMHALRRTTVSKSGKEPWRRIAAKKRYIDPLIKDVGRVSAYSERFRAEVEAFLADPQAKWIAWK